MTYESFCDFTIFTNWMRKSIMALKGLISKDVIIRVLDTWMCVRVYTKERAVYNSKRD